VTLCPKSAPSIVTEKLCDAANPEPEIMTGSPTR
jgi:hypothetical protein